MTTPTTEGVAERPRRRRLFGQWIGDFVVCLLATIPIGIPLALVETQAWTQREDRWRFDAMPESDGALMAWANSQSDLRGFRAERPPGGGQLVLRYERRESKGPAKPDWESLGYKMAYLLSATHPSAPHPQSAGMEGGPAWVYWGLLLALAVVVGVVAAYRLRRACRLGEPLIWLADRPRPGWWKWLLASVAGVILIQLIQIAVLRPFGIDPMAPNETTRMLWRTSGLASAAAFLALVLAVPVAEEVLFRGLLLGRFGAHGYWRAGIFVSALVFMLAHGDATHSIELFAAGLLLAWLYQRTGSLWPPIALHTLNNAFSYALAVFGKQP